MPPVGGGHLDAALVFAFPNRAKGDDPAVMDDGGSEGGQVEFGTDRLQGLGQVGGFGDIGCRGGSRRTNGKTINTNTAFSSGNVLC